MLIRARSRPYPNKLDLHKIIMVASRTEVKSYQAHSPRSGRQPLEGGSDGYASSCGMNGQPSQCSSAERDHHAALRGQKQARSGRVEREENYEPRRLDPPLPQVASPVGYVGAGVPLLSTPCFAADESLDPVTTNFLNGEKEKKKVQKANEEAARWRFERNKRKRKQWRKKKAPKTSSPLSSRSVRVRRCGQVLRFLSVAVRRPCAYAVPVPAVQGVREYDGPSPSVHRQSVGHSCSHSAKLCRTPSRSHMCSLDAPVAVQRQVPGGPDSTEPWCCRSCSLSTAVDILVVAQRLVQVQQWLWTSRLTPGRPG